MIVVVGLSHRTAPIQVRERLALPADTVPSLLRSIVTGPIGEALIVSTCNRVELVVAGTDGVRSNLAEVAIAARAAMVARAPGVEGHLYAHAGADAVRHLFRVAASLDSLVLGEPQILGQLKDAYDVARDTGTAAGVLNRVIPRALRSAKRVRSETTIGVGQVSVPTVAVDLTRQIFRDLSRHTVALVGSGEMGEAAARLLRQAGARLIVVGRNMERVGHLASAMGGEARSLSELDKTLVDADVIVTTTSAPGYLIDARAVQKHRRARKGRNLFFIDLAVPRDVEPAVGELDSVFLYNIDDLSNVVAESLQSRQREAERAEAIVVEETASYERWAEAEQVTPTIVALRERIRAILESEVDRSLGGKLKHLSVSDREALMVMMEAALNKMLHPATAGLRRLATDPSSRADLEQAVTALHYLFELSPRHEASGVDSDPRASMGDLQDEDAMRPLPAPDSGRSDVADSTKAGAPGRMGR
ncbi:MAG TPA: glutamyl-tRNA reductase [Polyangiaceae bacterium]|nr:glutamyl-tRNA reductase [Polyangiaceae bacterium]